MALAFGTFDSTKGAVNLTKVTHGAINGGEALTQDDTATSVGFKSSTTLPGIMPLQSASKTAVVLIPQR